MIKTTLAMILLVGAIMASVLKKDNQEKLYAREYGSGVELLSDISEKYKS